MPCLHSEVLESMSADGATPGASPCPGREHSTGKGARKERPVVTSAGWFFSPLWSPRARTRRWGFGNGVESERVEAWLDDHSDFARSYFLRRASKEMESGWFVEKASSPQTSKAGGPRSPSDPHSSMLRLGRRKEPSPPGSPSLPTSTPPVYRYPPQTSTLSPPAWREPCSSERPVSRSPRSSRSPLSPRTHRSPRPPRRDGPCGRGEACAWMMGLLGRGSSSSRTGSMVELCQGALLHAGEVVAAERCSLSLVRADRDGGRGLEGVVALTELGCAREAVHSSHAHLELVKGIMGYVVATGVPLNIRDAYEDPRITADVDQTFGYKLKSVLSVPIRNYRDQVVGAALVINKSSHVDGHCCVFTDQDEKVLSTHMGLLGLALDNAQLYESSRQEAKRSKVLLDLAQLLSEDHWSLEALLRKMAATILPFIQAQFCTIFIAKEEDFDVISRVVHVECEELGSTLQIFKRDCDITEVDPAYALRVLRSTEMLNVSNDSQDPTRSLICCPIRNAKTDKVVAVCQLKNKLVRDPGEAFNQYDEHLLEDFAVYCGLALQYAKTIRTTEKHRASLDVTQEVLSYQITAAEEEIQTLQEAPIPSAQSLHILELSFNDFGLSDTDTAQATIRMFLDLNLVQDFNMDYKSLCQWVLSVRRGYRSDVPYHNWSHGLSTAQCMFAMLMSTDQLQSNFSRLEVLALMIATLNHDLDHRGLNNSYIERSQHPLAQLYGTSSLEHHHYALCLFILNNQGSQILSGLCEEDYRSVQQMIERAILATDLAVYVEKREEFFALAEKGGVCWEEETHRDLLRSMLMTASDISAITKPWPVQRRTAELVATEFFAQGDREREEFHIKPVNVMNREKRTHLPHMQVSYIDGICHPLYQALSGMFDSFSPLLDGCRQNRDNWQGLAEQGEVEEEGEVED